MATPELTRWHVLFGSILEEVLGPVGVLVKTEVVVSTTPPEIDILLIQNLEAPAWTPNQQARLPDGIRESCATHIVIEFKYTESVTDEALQALIGYEVFYRRIHCLDTEQVQAVLVSAHTPRQTSRKRWGYTRREPAGVYWSTEYLLRRTPLIVLNELSNAPHNVFFKLFAQRRRARQEALRRFEQQTWQEVAPRVSWIVRGLMDVWNVEREPEMHLITKEDLLRRGKELPRLILPLLTDEEFEEVLDNSPYMQRKREAILKEGLEWGLLTTRRRDIAEVLKARFGLDDQTLADLERRLSAVTAATTLHDLFQLALRAESIAAFEAALPG
ncbi:MAG: hypothetical protein HC884_05005 [Chloroflexaceae bacterium]|nr:hypothetical protein [Chloroflexaceae bacterium]